MKKKRIPKFTPCSGLDEYFLICRENGKIEVKDGRTLEEYINDPRLVKIRKNGKESEMILCTRNMATWGMIPRTA